MQGASSQTAVGQCSGGAEVQGRPVGRCAYLPLDAGAGHIEVQCRYPMAVVSPVYIMMRADSSRCVVGSGEGGGSAVTVTPMWQGR
jgi:hypothetical protein